MWSVRSHSGQAPFMNVSDLERLYEFVAESRHRFLAKFRDLGWAETNRDRGATQGSMHAIFVHMLEVEDSWLHYDIPGKPWPYGDRDPSAFTSFDTVEAYDEDLSGRTEELLRGLTDADLGREVEFDGARGRVKSTVEHIAIHTAIDEIAHLGELVALLWQLDVEPPWRNWIRRYLTEIGSPPQ